MLALGRALVKSRRLHVFGLSVASKFSYVLIVAGLIIIFFPLIQSSFFEPPKETETERTDKQASGQPQASAFGPIRIADTLTEGTAVSQPPTRIIIPTVNIDVPVNEAKLTNGFWEVSETTASHGMGSSYPGSLGNTVLFAHARAGLFLPLRNINIGDSVYVLTNDRWHRYRVENKREVQPTDVTVIQPTQDETLTLFTCSGFLDSKRLIVVAKPNR